MTRNFKAAATTAIATTAVAAMLASSAAPAEAKNGRNARLIGGIAAGLIGAAIANSAARGQHYQAPAYGGECYGERRPVYDRWGEFRGYRLVQICD